MLPAGVCLAQASSSPPRKLLSVLPNGDQNTIRKQAPLLKGEQYTVPQRRSSRNDGARDIVPVVDKAPSSNPLVDHGLSLRVSTPKANSSTSPLNVLKTREKKAMPPLATTSMSTKTNTHNHIADENKPPRASLENDPGLSMLPPTYSTESTYPDATSLVSSKPRPNFHSKELEETLQPEQPSTSIPVAPNSLQQTHTGPQRRHSIRKRVFTRMLGGIQDKGKRTSSTGVVQCSTTSVKGSSDDTENNGTTSSWNPGAISTPRESTTVDLTEYDDNYRQSLVPNNTTPSPAGSIQFPTKFPPSPPQSNLALTTDGINPLYPNNPREPKVVLGVTLTASPEVESLDLSRAESMWAAVQIRGEMFIPEGLATVGYNRSMDLVVVIDNSKFCSAPCLKSACIQVMHLARLLQNPSDRLAVFTTVCCHESESQESSGSCQLHTLGRPKIHTLENGLHTLTQPKQNPTLHSPSFFDTLVAAHNALESVDENHNTSISRSIIVLTPNPTALAEVVHITPFRIHVVLPGIAPFSSPPFDVFSGWWLNAGMTPMPFDFDEHHDRSYSHFRSLGDLIAFERSMSDVGQVTNVIVHIKPGKAATIERIVGDLWYPSLRPGQILSILVKINVKALATPTRSTGSRSPSSSSPSSLEDTFAHVELMLGKLLSELLSIDVVYSHSYFPDNTKLTVHESCWLLRTDSMLGQPSPCIELRNERRKSFIRELLAYQLSFDWHQRNGLTKLKKALRQNDFDVCENYLGLLKEELAFQRSIETDDSFVADAERNGPPAAESSPHHSYFPFEYQHNTCDDVAELGKAKRNSSTGSPATIIHRHMPSAQSPNEFGVDAAQKIWRHIRKHSKTRHELDQIAANAAEENEEIKKIKQRALKNNRSVGVDSLRSLAFNINSSGDGRKETWV